MHGAGYGTNSPTQGVQVLPGPFITIHLIKDIIDTVYASFAIKGERTVIKREETGDKEWVS